MNANTDLEYIVNSAKQITVLRTLQSYSSSVRKRKLKDDSGVSRSTINRAIKNLTKRKWIEEKSRNRYQITTMGKAVIETYDEFQNAILESQTKAEMINHLGEHADSLSIDVLAKADVEKYPAANPQKGWNRAQKEAVKQIEQGVETFRGMNAVVTPHGNEIGRKLLTTVADAELIIDEDVFDTSKTNYPNELEHGREANNLHMKISPQPVPFTLAIYDEERVEISIHDENGHSVGHICGTDERLSQWAKEIYNQYQTESYPISELLQEQNSQFPQTNR